MCNDMLADLKSIDVDVDKTIERFCDNVELFITFVKRFPEDKCLSELCNAYEKGDVQGAFASAHTIKGVTGNLGFTRIYKTACELTEHLRTGEMPPNRSLLNSLEANYEELLTVISKY